MSLTARRRGFRLRHHIVTIEPLAEFGVRGDFGVADAEIGVSRIVAHAAGARAALDLGDAFAPQPLIGQQGEGSRRPVGASEDDRQRHAVLDRLVGALSEMRKHGMRGIAEQAQPSLGPAGQRLAVVQRPAKGLLHFAEHFLNARIPAGKFLPQGVGIAGR